MREIIQLVVSFTGSLGFAALFNIHGKKLWFAALGGCLSWAVYLIVGIWTLLCMQNVWQEFIKRR